MMGSHLKPFNGLLKLGQCKPLLQIYLLSYPSTGVANYTLVDWLWHISLPKSRYHRVSEAMINDSWLFDIKFG